MLAAMILARRRRLADRLFESYVPRSDPSSLRRSPNPQFCEVRPPQPIAAIRDRHLHRSSRHSPLLTQPLLEQRAHLLNSGDQQGPPSARPPSTASKCNEEPQNRSKISHFLRIGPPPARPKRAPSRRIPPTPPPTAPSAAPPKILITKERAVPVSRNRQVILVPAQPFLPWVAPPTMSPSHPQHPRNCPA